MKRSYKLIIAAVVLFVIALNLGLLDTSTNTSVETAQIQPQDIEVVKTKQISAADKIDLNAYSEYTKEAFPKLYSLVGDNGFKILFQHDMESAYKVAARNDCDRVIYSAYSEKSNYPSRIISFVRCQNGNVFDVSKDIIKKR